jgi:UDP-glucose 4-epimerase
MKVLVTGGAGYIGSTVASACLDAGITPVVLDNLATGCRRFVDARIFYEGDVADQDLLDKIFTDHPDIRATIHCAALVAVPESVRRPSLYYHENVAKGTELLRGLLRNGCARIILSSSASVYGGHSVGAVDEDGELTANSPYAWTKLILEQMLRDAGAAGEIRAIALRYFNPVGADPMMRTGPQKADPSHVLGQIIKAQASGAPFRLTGTSWPTRDGSGLRDYVHVWDLARGHVAALTRFDAAVPGDSMSGFEAINLGAGRGITVREMVEVAERVVGRRVHVVESAARPGDVAGCFASIDKARTLLHWRPALTVEHAVAAAVEWRDRLSLGLREDWGAMNVVRDSRRPATTKSGH